MFKQPQAVVLIAAYNEASYIAPVIRRASTYLPVLVVDDGSHDQTMAVAHKAGAIVLHHPHNQGKGAALRTGLRWAVSHQVEFVVTLDGDGQHDPLEIPQFMAAYRDRRADLIIGCRSFSEMPFVRRVSNWIARQGFSLVVGQPIPDNQSGYRLIGNRLMGELLASPETGFEFEVEMITTCLQQGFQLDWVPIRTIYGQAKSHIHPVQHTFNFLRLLWQTQRRLRQTKRISQRNSQTSY